jgi:Asp-tRNA(Asn)/Glu-tRNA(Gln) amidotransferase A subunit family amidase
MGNEIFRMTAAGIAQRIRDRELSPIEVTEACLSRIHERNDRTNAFVTITDDLARDMAEEAEEAPVQETVAEAS